MYIYFPSEELLTWEQEREAEGGICAEEAGPVNNCHQAGELERGMPWEGMRGEWGTINMRQGEWVMPVHGEELRTYEAAATRHPFHGRSSLQESMTDRGWKDQTGRQRQIDEFLRAPSRQDRHGGA